MNTFTKNQVVSKAKYMCYLLAVSFNERRVWKMLDLRTNFDKQVLSEIKKNRISHEDGKRIKELRKIRRERVFEFTPIFENPIIKDYLSNKSMLKGVFPGRLCFYGRNHWAKTTKDRKIIDVLRSNYMKSIQP